MSCTSQPKSPKSPYSMLSKFLQSINIKRTSTSTTTGSKNKPPSNDSFIIKHLHQNQDIDNDAVQSTLDQRRVVFVSLIGLYTSWKKVPPSILY
eukprot:205933_1